MKLGKAGAIQEIAVRMGFTTVTFKTGMFKDLTVTPTSSVQLSVSKVDPSTLNPDTAVLLGTNTILDFTLSLDGTPITGFDHGDIQVAMPYSLASGENPHQVVVNYISDDGKPETVNNGRFNPKKGEVCFKPDHFSKYAPHYAEVNFSDLKSSPWAEDAVAALAARGAINGKQVGVFEPEGAVTRGEFVKMLVQLLDLGDPSAQAEFTDVADQSAWYYHPVASAYKLGLVNGREDGTFGLEERISREDMAVLMHRTARYISGTTGQPKNNIGYKDMELVSPYARDAVAFAEQAGLMNGISVGRFDAQGHATRAMAATVIYRLFTALE